MGDIKKLTSRKELKTFFETGDRPTESQFSDLIDSYAHLNEFNFGLSIRSSAQTSARFYHFYIAKDVENSGAGHLTVEGNEKDKPEMIDDYHYILSRNVHYKSLDIALVGEIDIEKHQPKIIIERYKQRKVLRSGYVKPAGFYKEKIEDAKRWNRCSEYEIKSKNTIIDIEPIHYFRPKDDYKEFMPSGSVNKRGTFKYKRHRKPFVPIQILLEININGNIYRSRPVKMKIILGSSGEYDAINFAYN